MMRIARIIYETLMDRERWVGVLEQRFPQLRGLSMGQDQWENCVDSVSIIRIVSGQAYSTGILAGQAFSAARGPRTG